MTNSTIEGIRTQVGYKGRVTGDLFFIHAELFGHDIDHAFFNGSHEQSLGDVSKLKVFIRSIEGRRCEPHASLL